MNNVKQMLVVGLMFSFFTACQQKKELIHTNNKVNNLDFKTWLKDTTIILGKEINLDYFKKDVIISDDSLSMDIVKYYDKSINPKKISEIKNKDLIYALDLLTRNNELPNNEFILKFTISSYYSVSMVEQLKYDYDTEVKLFEVIDKNKKIKYNFMKGNLIDKRIIK